MDNKQAQKPQELPEYSEAVLQALVAHGLSDKISLGGAFGLLHYLDYRQTHDVAAWWADEVSGQEQQLVVETIATALHTFGQVAHRRWGDVVSVELIQLESGEKWITRG